MEAGLFPFWAHISLPLWPCAVGHLHEWEGVFGNLTLFLGITLKLVVRPDYIPAAFGVQVELIWFLSMTKLNLRIFIFLTCWYFCLSCMSIVETGCFSGGSEKVPASWSAVADGVWYWAPPQGEKVSLCTSSYAQSQKRQFRRVNDLSPKNVYTALWFMKLTGKRMWHSKSKNTFWHILMLSFSTFLGTMDDFCDLSKT